VLHGEFRFNLKIFFIGHSTYLLLYRRMRAGGATGTEAGSWSVEAERVSVTARTRKSQRVRFDDDREKSGRVVIVSSLFLVLIAAALLVGGHAAIDPLMRSAMVAREARGVGDVFYTMPDGIFCRHMSFDNATAVVTEGAIERCVDDVVREHAHAANRFAWGAQ
jgi:hypothetical protein